MIEAAQQGFDAQKSPMREAYSLLDATTPLDLSNRYDEEDQKIATNWDYRNPDLITNKVKNIVENADVAKLTDEEKVWRREILWFWHHHALQFAAGLGDKSTAQKFATQALVYQGRNHPNKITKLLYFLVHDRSSDAEKWLGAIEGEEKETAQDLFKAYKAAGFS